MNRTTIAAVIPSFKVKNSILKVIEGIGPEVHLIYVIDDCCPDGSGDFVEQFCRDPRVTVVRHTSNQGVGGAVMTGYKSAMEAGADIMIKLDGDGQMDPALIKNFIAPILRKEADYTKGNRFYDLETLKSMPSARLFGNAVLSFMTKFSSGYYHVFDPTNGYTAISATAARMLPLSKISRRYFFESDILFRLNTIGAVVTDIPMAAVYGDEISNLHIRKILFPFLKGHFLNFSKRVFYNYFLRGFSIATLELVVGLVMLIFGTLFGLQAWYFSSAHANVASSGTVMLSALPIILGVQLLLSFLHYDIENVPKISLVRLLHVGSDAKP
jgi:glycosyltransferase involved in cell wall biosynthesis